MYEVDEDAWRALLAIVTAAHRGDEEAFASATTELTRALDLERQRIAGLYLAYLLRYALAAAVGGRRPTAHELTELATEHADAFGSLVRRAEAGLLERTLLTAYKLIPRKDEVEGARFSLAATAALGILVKDPVGDLDAIRPHLIAWCDMHSEDFWRTVRAR